MTPKEFFDSLPEDTQKYVLEQIRLAREIRRKEIIDSMPADLRPWAELWLPVLLAWGEDEIREWFSMAMGADWDQAYQDLVNAMTTDQKVENLKLVNETLAKLNQSNEALVSKQREMILTVITKALVSVNV